MSISEFLLILVVILIFAKGLGELCQIIGQPAVIGELLAGIIIGPSVLAIIQDVSIFEHNSIFYLLAEIGVLLLLFEVGLETELSELLKVGEKSIIIGFFGILLPFAFAFGFCFFVGGTTMESIMIAAALTATSIGITSKVFEELNILQSQEAKIVIGAAIVDDILALAILGVISSMASTNEKLSIIFILITIGISILFLVISIVVGKIFVNHLVTLLEKMRGRGVMWIGAIAFALIFALLADKAGSSIIIGSFAAGILLAGTRKREIIMEGLKPIVDFFTPIFFVSVGIAMNISIFNPFNLDNLPILVIIFILTLIAVITKILPAYLIKLEKGVHRNLIGLGMVPRGEVGLIFASMGKVTEVLTNQMYNIIVAVVVLSTIIAPLLIKIAIKNKQKREVTTNQQQQS